MFLVHHPVTFKGRIYQTLEVTILQERSSTLPQTWRNSERKLTKSWKWPVLSLGALKQLGPSLSLLLSSLNHFCYLLPPLVQFTFPITHVAKLTWPLFIAGEGAQPERQEESQR